MDTLMGRYRNVSILAAAIFLQIVGLAIQVKRRSENHSTRLIRVWTVAAITPLEKNIVRLQTGTSDIWHNYLYLRGVRQQNRELQDQIQQLQLEQVRLRQDAQQARRLQALLGFKEQFIDKTTAAQVIGSSGSEQSRIVYLDKGSADGIAQDMAVISAQGVVGKVIQVFRHTAQVLLINDQTSGVGTILEQSRLQGVLKGKATGELVLDKIMAEEEVKSGDRVLTSGGDQIFPKGLPVGTVANITRGGEFLLVTVRPAASLNHLEEVLVITKKQEHEPAVSAATSVRAADILAQRLPSVPDKPETPAVATVSANASGAVQSKTQPKTPALAGGNAPKAQPPVGAPTVHSTIAAPNVQTSTAVPKSQTPIATSDGQAQTAAPRTKPVDFVPKDTAASSQATAAGNTKKLNANTTAVTPAKAAGTSQNKPQAIQPKTSGPSSATTKPPVAGTSTTLPASSAPKKTGMTGTQPPKPVKPTAPPISKPAANTQPATQPDTSGDAPQ